MTLTLRTARPRASPAALLRVGALLLILLTSTSLSGPAHAATGEGPETGVGITPARSEVDLPQRSYSSELSIFNDSSEPKIISIDAVELGHELDGTPVLGDPLNSIELVGVDRNVTLAPGESIDVPFVASFPDQVSLYGAVVARVAPADGGEAIAVRTQVGALLLLRGPRPWDQSVEIRDLGIIETTGAQRLLFVDVENVGDAHVRPTGIFTVRADEETVAQVELPGENVLPGYARRLTAPLGATDPGTNELTVEIELDDGSSSVVDVDLSELPTGTAGSPSGDTPGTAVLEQPDGLENQAVDGQRRALLPLAAFLILLALGALWWMLMWKRRDEEEDDEDAEGASVEAVVGAGGDDPD